MKKQLFDEVVTQIYKTYDYGKFKIMADNRNVNLLHVKRLVQSFKEEQLICPIIVNEKFEVIDGQHRFNAAKETNLPIYYYVVDGYGISQVQKLNTNQKNWTKIDYLEAYCASGVKSYLQFKQFMNDFKDFGILSSERIILNLAGKRSERIGDSKASSKYFEEGKLEINDLSSRYRMAKKITDIKPFYSNYYRGTFVSTMITLLNNKKYNHSEMIKKLSVCPIKLVDCISVEAYKMLLETICNWKRREDEKVSFRFVN